MSGHQTREIQEWAEKPTPESARSLIRIYHESEWRSSRLEVIQALGRFSDSRSLPFLIEIIKKNQDLAEQEAAVLSLGRQKTKGARVFLHSYYPKAPDTLKSVLAYAIGQAGDFSASTLLLESFSEAEAKQDYSWLKNLILSLGELKVYPALPRIRALLESGVAEEQGLLLPVLLSIGRLERDPTTLSRNERRFMHDALSWQVYQSALNQVQIRSQFKLEDYLSKIFESPHPHSVLPLELNAFEESDVRLGLSLFPRDEHWRRHLLCLKILPKSLQEEFLAGLTIEPSLWAEVLDGLAKSGGLQDPASGMSLLEGRVPELQTDLSLRLHFLAAFSSVVNWSKESTAFLSLSDDSLAIRFLNHWSEWALSAPSKIVQAQLRDFMSLRLSEHVYARLLRAAVECGADDKALLTPLESSFNSSPIRGTLLLYAETFGHDRLLEPLSKLTQTEMRAQGSRVLAYLESMLTSGKIKGGPALKKWTVHFETDPSPEHQAGVLRLLRMAPEASDEAWVIEKSKSEDYRLALNAVIALKAFSASRVASEALVERMESGVEVIRGRALDSLCAHTTLVAKRGVMAFLAENIGDEEVVDKICRCFDPENKGGPEFVSALSGILAKNPDHPQWEKLVALRDRMGLAAQTQSGGVLAEETSQELRDIDSRLETAIPKFKALDPTTKLALRAAEQPFLQSGIAENLPIDKAPTVLEYCKALDLILERHLGQKHLFPKLDRELHDFQTLWQRVGFGEDYPQGERVMTLLGLKGKITPEHFPLHKAKMMCGTFFNGKIIQDRFKIFDGLRAWAVIFLVFARKIPLQTGPVGPVLKLQGATDERCISIAKRLMALQDLRNPAAHRQTYGDLSSVKNVRNEAVELVNIILELVL